MKSEKFHICALFPPDFPIYVGNQGTIKRVNKFGRVEVLNQFNNNGYKKVSIGGQSYFVHRLVALVHIRQPKTNERLVVDHINGNKTDNRSCNLRWVTQDKNVNNPNTLPKMKNHGTKYIGVNPRTNEVIQIDKVGGFVSAGISIAKAIKASKNNADLRNEIKTVRDIKGNEWVIYQVSRIFERDGKETWVSSDVRKERKNRQKDEEPIVVEITARLRVPPPKRVAKRFQED